MLFILDRLTTFSHVIDNDKYIQMDENTKVWINVKKKTAHWADEFSKDALGKSF